jgi:hypothetical protein
MVRDEEGKIMSDRKRDTCYWKKDYLWIWYCSFKAITRGDEERHWVLTMKEQVHLSIDGIEHPRSTYSTIS